MATPGLDILAQAAVAKEYGFDAMDLRVGAPGKGEVPEKPTVAQVKMLLLACNGIAISSLLCYNKTVRAGEAEMTASVLENLALANMLQCPMIRVFTGKVETEEQMASLLSALRAVLQKDGSRVKIGLQIHKNNGISVTQAVEICRQIPDERLGIILSPDQSILAGENDLPHLPELAKRTLQVYVADLDAQGQFTLIGEGVIDFEKEIRILSEHGFRGLVTLKWEKCWYPDMPDHTVAFPAYLRYYQEKIAPLG